MCNFFCIWTLCCAYTRSYAHSSLIVCAGKGDEEEVDEVVESGVQLCRGGWGVVRGGVYGSAVQRGFRALLPNVCGENMFYYQMYVGKKTYVIV